MYKVDLKTNVKFIFIGTVVIICIILLHLKIVQHTLSKNKRINHSNTVLVSNISDAKAKLKSLLGWQTTLFQAKEKKIEYLAQRKINEMLSGLTAFFAKIQATDYTFTYNNSISDLRHSFESIHQQTQQYTRNNVKSKIDGEIELKFRSSCQLMAQLLNKFEKDVLSNIEANNQQTYNRILLYLLFELTGLLFITILLLVNISMRRQTEKEINKIRKYLDNVINSMPSVIIGVDKNRKIMQWNNTAEKMTGISANDSLGKELEKVLPQMSGEMSSITDSIKYKKINKDTNKVVNSEKKQRVEDITIYPLITNGIEGAVIRIDDVTEKTKMAEVIKQSQKMDAIGQLAGGVAHDFNNMLAGIMGCAELLKSTGSRTAKELKHINTILDASTRAAELTKKLLTFGRQDKPQMESLDMHSIIKNSTDILKRTINKKVHIKTILQAEYSIIAGDKARLQSIILNLGINAAHAMPNGGELTIKSKVTRLDKSYCSMSQFELKPGNFLEIEIMDTGCGISKEALQKIFEPFYTTKEAGKGTGLGLSTSYSIIKEHNGAIIVYSEVKVGTIFRLFLPISLKGKKSAAKTEQTITGQGVILLVDDEEIIRDACIEMLNSIGYKVFAAPDGVKAIELYKDLHQEIDLVITDMIMPKLNGYETFEELKKINPNVKAIISTGFSKEEDIQSLIASGLKGVISKPFRKSELSKAIAEALTK